MTKLTPEQLLEIQNFRYATKQFDATKKISASDWSTLEKSLLLTASSYGIQPWKFLVIQDSALRKTLRVASWNQSQVEDCSHFVVFATLKSVSEQYVDHFLQSVSKARGAPLESLAGYRNMMLGDFVHGPRSKIASEWCARQAYIALGNFMTSAAALQIDTCAMEGFEPARYNEILGLSKTDYHAVVACPAGYRSTADKSSTAPKVRFSADELIQHL